MQAKPNLTARARQKPADAPIRPGPVGGNENRSAVMPSPCPPLQSRFVREDMWFRNIINQNNNVLWGDWGHKSITRGTILLPTSLINTTETDFSNQTTVSIPMFVNAMRAKQCLAILNQ